MILFDEWSDRSSYLYTFIYSFSILFYRFLFFSSLSFSLFSSSSSTPLPLLVFHYFLYVMRIVVTTETDEMYHLEIDSQMAIEDLKALLEVESGISSGQQSLFYDGQLLNEAKKTLEEYKVLQDDLLLMRVITRTNNNPSTEGPNFDVMRQHVLRDPRLLQQLANTNPELARAALNDPARFSAMVQQIEQSRRQAESQRAHLTAGSDDPFDIEAQKRIEDAIRQENIAANLEAAMEYNPESFARVTRLYINVEINGCKLVALVDSGAQSTVTQRLLSDVI
ncbi:hypothetical protein F4703DRAFT_1550249 [Phycomyces blakesleeanus]